MYVGFVIGRYKIQDHFDPRGDRFVRCLYNPQHGRRNRSVREEVKVATYGRYLDGRPDVTD